MIELTYYAIQYPRPLAPATVLEMLRRLAADHSRPPFFFEAIGSGHQVRYRVGVPARGAAVARQLISALIPGAVLDEDPAGEVGSDAAVRLISRGASMGLNTTRPLEATRSLLAALASARDGDTLVLQVFVGASRSARLSRPKPQDPSQTLLDQLLRGPREATSDVAHRMRDKAAEQGIQSMVRLAVESPSISQRHALLKCLIGALQLAQSAGTKLGFKTVSNAYMGRIPLRDLIDLTPDEILSLGAWPLGDTELPGLAGLHPKPLRLSGPAIKTDRIFGVTTAPGDAREVGISIEDAVYHSLTIGPNGVGKSNFLLSQIAADMKAGRSVLVIDPKSDLGVNVLERVPHALRSRTVVIDPLHDFPVGINPLKQPGRAPELIADGIVTTIRNLFPNMFGPRTSDVLNASLLSIVNIPGATLTWLVRLLTDPKFRRHIVDQLDDDLLVSYWSEFDSMSAAQQAQFVGPVLSRLRQFLLRPQLRRALDQAEPKFNLADLFTGEPKLVVVPLNSGLLGTEATALLGSLLVAQLAGLTLGRAAVPQKDRTPVVVWIDEAAEFLRMSGDDMADLLARARSMRVSFNLAAQHRGAFSDVMREALDVNARSKVVFQPGPADAAYFAKNAPELEARDFLDLKRYHVYANLMRDGQMTGWFSARTHEAPPETADPAAILKRSQRLYGQGASEPLTFDDPLPGEIGRRRRSS